MEMIILWNIIRKTIFESSTFLARRTLDGRDMGKPYPLIVLNDGVSLLGSVQK